MQPPPLPPLDTSHSSPSAEQCAKSVDTWIGEVIGEMHARGQELFKGPIQAR